MRRIWSVAAAVALGATGGSAEALFNVASVAVTPYETLTPSSGSFVTLLDAPDQENFYLVPSQTGEGKVSVTLDPSTWSTDRNNIMSTTWLALDRLGPRGHSGTAPYGEGWFGTGTVAPSTTVHLPEWNGALTGVNAGSALAANGALGDPVNGDGLSPGFVADNAGFAWFAPETENYSAPSAPTVINAQLLDSLFIGHFVLTDLNADVVGGDLYITFQNDTPGPEAGQSYYFPLDGSLGAYDYRIVTERTTVTNDLGMFTAVDMYLVPSPASLAPLLGVALGARRRRR
jgi:hypothetical protein